MSQTPSPTYIGLTPVSSICTTGHRANVITGIVLRLLREHFSTPAELEFNPAMSGEPAADLSAYVWKDNRKDASIIIDPVWLWNSQDVQRRPALYVRRESLKNNRIALDHGWTVGAPKNEEGKIIEVPGELHSTMIVGGHSVIAVGTSGAEAELLGQEAFNHLMEFGPLIRRDVKLNKWDVAEWSSVAKLEESHEHFVTTVACTWAYSQTWTLRQEAPWLKTLSVDIQAQS